MPHLRPEESAALIERARQCDKDAFDKLWENYKDAVRGFIRPCLLYKKVVDDVLQQIYKETWRMKAGYDTSKGTFYDWLIDWAQIVLTALRLQILKYLDRQTQVFLLVADTCIKIDNPPHQVLAFLFNVVLKYGPERIVKQLSNIPLSSLTYRVENEYVKRFRSLPIVVEPYFQLLHDAMAKTVGQANPNVPPETPLPDPAAIMGSTRMYEYYGEDPWHQISQWSWRKKQELKGYRWIIERERVIKGKKVKEHIEISPQDLLEDFFDNPPREEDGSGV